MKLKLFCTYLTCIILHINSFALDSLYLNAIISGEKYGDKFSVVENAGDVNGDGFDDLLVGAPGADLTVSYAGAYTKLFFGGTPFDTIADVKFESHEEFTQFGHSLAGNGDLNSDGYSDFVIGDYMWGDFEYGRIYIYYGGEEIDTIPELIISGTPWVDWYNNLGFSVAIDGDVNGDGFDDIIVGAPMDDRLRMGKVYIYFGGTEMDTVYDVYLSGQDTSGMFGNSVAYAGDVNKDGYDDFLVSAPQWDAFNYYPCKTFLFYGGEKDSIDFSSAVEFVCDSIHKSKWVGGLGDLNNDGYDDFGIKNSSSVFVVIKGASFSNSFVIDTIYSENIKDISKCLNLNKDGYNDFMIGSAIFDGKLQGRVMIFSGGEIQDTLPYFIIKKSSKISNYASSITVLEDTVNDIIVVGDDHGKSNENFSKIYVYSTNNSTNISSKHFQKTPGSFELYPNFPNPFNPSTRIRFDLPVISDVKIAIFNIQGQYIKTYKVSNISPGNNEIEWDGKNSIGTSVSSGLYFYRFTAISIENKTRIFKKSSKMLLLR